MNLIFGKEFVINGAKHLIIETDNSLFQLNITNIIIKNSQYITIAEISYLKQLSIENCNHIIISGNRIDIVEIKNTLDYSLTFNIIQQLNIDKNSIGNVIDNKKPSRD